MKKKYILFIIILIGMILSILIYLSLQNDKINIISLGDSYSKMGYNMYLKKHFSSINKLENYNLEYAIDNIKTEELIQVINKNEFNNKTTIKQAISSSDIIILFIGMDELENGGNINLYIYNMDKLVRSIAQLKKDKVYIIGLSGNNPKIKDINNWLEKISYKYKVNYVDISDIGKENINNEEVQRKIFQKIIDNY